MGVPAAELYPDAYQAALDRWEAVRGPLSDACERNARFETRVLEVVDATEACIGHEDVKACVVHRRDGSHLVWIDYGDAGGLEHEYKHIMQYCVDRDGDGCHRYPGLWDTVPTCK